MNNTRPNICIACLARSVNFLVARFQSHYTVLGISQNATQKQIREAYIELSKKHHPDQNKGVNSSSEKFQKINEAYSVLSKDISRRDYDRTLLGNRPGTFQTRTHQAQATYSSTPRKTYRAQYQQNDSEFHNYHYHREWTKDYEAYQRQREEGLRADKAEYESLKSEMLHMDSATSRMYWITFIVFIMASLFLLYGFTSALVGMDERVANRNEKRRKEKEFRKKHWEDYYKRNRIANMNDEVMERSLREHHKEQAQKRAAAIDRDS
ncbi:dnaJ homolog subfamily C member 30, mitochondrial-like isoform X1 [Mya arenaria]|uniref:dnaJ homolog subfamily C member 30, mitochondrial-like isoform X1 n=1 Tax=Mya arenaria TaxID=6604 RepID=UPI0022E09FFC|nr:dnaJ homolog subfamily C member 30, mitochondrial-like isoform X1 [Mya arenaria]